MKPSRGRASGTTESKVPRRLKLNLSLDPATHARLTAYAAFRHEAVSDVVARACEAEMRSARFVVYQGAAGPVLSDAGAGRSAG